MTSAAKLTPPVRRVPHVAQRLARAAFTPFARVRVHHAEPPPTTGACIIACNHISHFDPPLIGGHAWRYVDWMAMQELFERPAGAALMRALDAFPVNRDGSDRQALRVALRRLEGGRVIGMFPEGGIRAGTESILNGAPMRPGVALLSILSGAPVYPVVIVGSDRLYHPRSWAPFGRVPVWITFGPAIHPDPALPREDARADVRSRLAAAFPALMAELIKRENLTAADLPQSPQRRKGREA